jgi:inosine-uridine nucleoside N-ribohydrolase
MLLWHADPVLGDPDDDYAAGVLLALSREAEVSLAGVVVNRRPVDDRARHFAAVLAALGIQWHGRPVPIGTGADSIGRPMPPVHPGAPVAPAPPPVDAHQLQARLLRQAPDESVTVLATTALTDLDWLLHTHERLARRKIKAVIMMSDARPSGPPGTGAPWVPGDAANNAVDPEAAARVFACLQDPIWRHVQVMVISRWAVLGAGEVAPAFLDRLAAANPVAAWLRERAVCSMNERWSSFCRGEIPGRDRAAFVANHLGGRDPGRTADKPVYDLVTGIPLYDAVAAIAAVEPGLFQPEPGVCAPNFSVVGTSRATPGVRDPAGLRARLAGLLLRGFGASE